MVRIGDTTHRESWTDFEEYLLPCAQVLASSLFGWGVAEGLTVSAVADAAEVRVAPGVALDGAGRVISVAVGGAAVVDPGVGADDFVDVPTVEVAAEGVVVGTAGLTGDKLLTLRWREVQLGGAVPRFVHAPWLQLVDPTGFEDTGTQVVLAVVGLDGQGRVSALSAGGAAGRPGRRAVAVYAQRVQLCRPGVSEAGLVVEQSPAAELRAGPGGGVELAVVPAAGSARPVLAVDRAGGDIAIAPLGGHVGIGLGAQPAARALHVVGSEIHCGGAGAGFSFADRGVESLVENPAAGERWRWYAQSGSARLWSGADRLTIAANGNVGIGIGAGPAQRPLHVEGQEVHSGGPGGGFSFADRTSGSFVETPDAGQRWLWYAKDGAARLWSGTDKLAISGGGDATFSGNVSVTGNIGIGIGVGQARRSLDVEGTGIHIGGSGTTGGFSFADLNNGSFVQSPTRGERWVWYAQDGTARLWSGADHFSVAPSGNVGIGIDAGQAQRSVHVEGTGIHIGGRGGPLGLGGFSFADLNNGSFVQSPTHGERWVWYAQAGSALLWSGGILMTIDSAGNLWIKGRLTKGSSNSEIDHPLDPANKFLHHSAIECNEMKNLYDGVADLDAYGRAEVVLPDWFEALNESFRYQLTPIGAAAPDLHIAAELREGRFTIAGGQPNTTVCWQLSGVRHDAYAQAHPLQVEALKSPEEAARFVHPNEHNQPAERSLATLSTPPANDSEQG